MARPTPLSGFPEWLPPAGWSSRRSSTGCGDLRAVGLRLARHPVGRAAGAAAAARARSTRRCTSCGACRPTRDDALDASGLALHYDLTVPFARYVLENAGHLEFPLKRYQIQKCWRGERPQEGRYREFLQADIDVVGVGDLPFHYEAELPVVLAEALARACRCPPVRMQVNNRKLSQGFFRGSGSRTSPACSGPSTSSTRSGRTGSGELLPRRARGQRRPGRRGARVRRRSRPQTGRWPTGSRRWASSDPLLDEGLAELVRVVEAARAARPGLRRRRPQDRARPRLLHRHGLRDPARRATRALGSVCSGGRYDALASDGEHTLPGRRHLASASPGWCRACSARTWCGSRAVPTCVLVAVRRRRRARRPTPTAAALRRRGIAAEVAPAADKFGKQIRYADRRGIPFVWFPGDERVRRGQGHPLRRAGRCPPTRGCPPPRTCGHGSSGRPRRPTADARDVRSARAARS